MELRVKDICKEKGILMKDLAGMLGINRISLTSMINGNPTLQTLEKISATLGVEVVDLFEAKIDDFTALIDHGGKLHRFDNIEALKVYLSQITEKE